MNMKMVAATLVLGVAMTHGAMAWETNDDALRILGARLGSDGALCANVATLVERAGSAGEKAALTVQVPTEVVSPIEHLPVDTPYARLTPAARQRLRSAFDLWIAKVPALAPALRVVARISNWTTATRSPLGVDAFDAGHSGRTRSPQQLHAAALTYLRSANAASVERFLSRQPATARNLLISFESS
jgi:hypothetical protein